MKVLFNHIQFLNSSRDISLLSATKHKTKRQWKVEYKCIYKLRSIKKLRCHSIPTHRLFPHNICDIFIKYSKDSSTVIDRTLFIVFFFSLFYQSVFPLFNVQMFHSAN